MDLYFTEQWQKNSKRGDEEDHCGPDNRKAFFESDLIVDETPSYPGETIEHILTNSNVWKEMIIIDGFQSECFRDCSDEDDIDRDGEKSNPSLKSICHITGRWE